MNTMSVQKSDYRNELEGIGLSALFRSLPFFLVVAWMAKHKSGIAFFAQDGVALALAVMISAALPTLLRALELKSPDAFPGSCEPCFYDARLSVPQKLKAWCTKRKGESAWNAIMVVLMIVYVVVKGSF